MADAPPPEPPLKIPTQEEINQAALIDPAALEHWGDIPENAPVVLNAARSDIDRLLLGLRILTFGHGDALQALQFLSHGDSANADIAFRRAAYRNHQALTYLTQFTTAIMAKAQIDG